MLELVKNHNFYGEKNEYNDDYEKTLSELIKDLSSIFPPQLVDKKKNNTRYAEYECPDLDRSITDGLESLIKIEEGAEKYLSVFEANLIIDFLEAPCSKDAFLENFNLILRACPSYPLFIEDDRETLLGILFKVIKSEKDKKDTVCIKGKKYKRGYMIYFYSNILKMCNKLIKNERVHTSKDNLDFYVKRREEILESYHKDLDDEFYLLFNEGMLKLFRDSQGNKERLTAIFENTFGKSLDFVADWVAEHKSLEISKCIFSNFAKIFPDPLKRSIAIQTWIDILFEHEGIADHFTEEKIKKHINESQTEFIV